MDVWIPSTYELINRGKALKEQFCCFWLLVLRTTQEIIIVTVIITIISNTLIMTA